MSPARRSINRTTTCLVFCAASAGLTAFYSRPDVEDAPLTRVIANLTRQAELSPNNARLQLNLGRAHAMAWARGDDGGAEVIRSMNELWFGIDAPNVPLERRQGEPTKATSQHLAQALEHHRLAAELAPNDLIMQLGYAWVLEQSGRTNDAIRAYRRIVAEGWRRESAATMVHAGEQPVTAEAARYLLPLLDTKKDAAEIAELNARVATIAARPRGITPIVVPLADDASAGEWVDRSARVRFDLDGSGLRGEWQWITPRAAWLVYDATGSGRIDSALRMFGSVTFWMFWENGYQALASLDDNADGEIAGAELRGLALWIDANANGVSEAGEVRPLSAHGIVALSCAYTAGDAPHLAAMSARGARFSDGRVRPTYDVVLKTAKQES